MYTFAIHLFGMKVYTKAGDKGRTSLFGGAKLSKDDVRIEAYGTLDELNSHIGYLLSMCPEKEVLDILMPLQEVLFDVGSHLASDGTANDYLPQLKDSWIALLESTMDRYSEDLPELKSFILPRANGRIAYAHICRTVCRRAERRIISVSEIEKLNDFIIPFVNRLSDYFFVLARYLTHLDGLDEEKWTKA